MTIYVLVKDNQFGDVSHSEYLTREHAMRALYRHEKTKNFCNAWICAIPIYGGGALTDEDIARLGWSMTCNRTRDAYIRVRSNYRAGRTYYGLDGRA